MWFRSALSAHSKSYFGTVPLTERGPKSSSVHAKATCHTLATVKATSSPPLTISEPELYRTIKYPQNGIWVVFSCCYGKIIRQRQIHSQFQGPGHRWGMSWQQELERAGHLASTIKKQKMMTARRCSALFSYFRSGSQPGNGATCIVHVLIVKTIERIPQRPTQRSISQVILDSVKLILKTIRSS